MRKEYIIKRIIVTIPIILLLTIFLYWLMYSSVEITENSHFISSHHREKGYSSIHIHEPFAVGYVEWVKGILISGSFGYSSLYRQPVAEVIRLRLGNTLLLCGASIILSGILGTLIGILQARGKRGILQYMIDIITHIGKSIPVFILALMLIRIFSYELNILPVSGMQKGGTYDNNFMKTLDILRHLIIPSFVLSIVLISQVATTVKVSFEKIFYEDYIRTARSKGLSEVRIVFYHALKNCIISIISILNSSFAELFSGALIVEQVFKWPGIGNLAFTSFMRQDYIVVTGVVLVAAFSVIIFGVICDILYSLIDPRLNIE